MGKSSPTNIQAKDIPDQVMIDLVDRLSTTPRAYMDSAGNLFSGKIVTFYPTAASIFDICKLWDTVPPKVIKEKLRKLIDKGAIDGCACGCRGDFTVVPSKNAEV